MLDRMISHVILSSSKICFLSVATCLLLCSLLPALGYLSICLFVRHPDHKSVTYLIMGCFVDIPLFPIVLLDFVLDGTGAICLLYYLLLLPQSSPLSITG